MLSRSKTVRHCVVMFSAVLAAALLSGCGTVSAGSADEGRAKRGDITPAQALDAVRAYDRGNNRVNKTLDAAGLVQLETAPLITSSQAFMKIDRELRQPIPVITSTDPKFVIPAQTAYPRWFLSISRRIMGGVPSPQPTYTIFTQKAESAPFVAAYALTPSDQEQLPDITLGRDGKASAVTSGDGLVISPADLGQEITDHYMKNLAGADNFEQSETLDNQLGAGYTLGVKALKKAGVSLGRSVEREIPQRYALATDGGALVFSAVEVRDILKSVKPGSSATLRSGGNDAALLGKPEGASAKSFTIERLEMFMTYVPTKASHAKAKVMAYSETGVSVK